MAKTDSAEAFKLQRTMLSLTGTWPEEGSSTPYKTKGYFFYSLGVTLATIMLANAFHNTTNLIKFSDALYISTTILVYVIKHGNFFAHRSTFIRMVKLLGDPIFTAYPDDLDELMAKRVSTSRFLAKFYRFLIFMYCLQAVATPLFDKQPLPYAFPYDLGRYRVYMFVYQAVAVFVVGWHNSCIDTLPACLMCVATAHLDILAAKILRMGEGSSLGEAPEENLKRCVKYHMAIIEYVGCLDRVFSVGALSQFMASALVICITLFRFLLIPAGSSEFFVLITYIFALLVELLMYCWFGNNIIWKSIALRDACYSSNWYSCGKDVRQYLFLVMERSKRPIRVTAYKFSTLSITAFTSVIQWSYSYFALLLKMYGKQRQQFN